VCSLGELVTAERGGFEAARLTLHGAGKTEAELTAALEGRVGRIVVDGMDELRAIAALASASRGAVCDVLLRFNTGIEAHTHDFVRTAGDRSKFGFAPNEESAAFELLRAHPSLRLRGVHAHVGSQIYDAMPYVENAKRLLAVLERARSAGFDDAQTLVIGGGFGVRMRPKASDENFDIAGTLDAVARIVPSGVRAEIEPGRALIGGAGTSLYRVVAVKRFDSRRFVIIDGSIADNPRPAIYGAYHHIVSAQPSGASSSRAMVCGRSCESDELGEAVLPDDLRAGDLVAMLTTGAYTYSMSSNYNLFPRPAVIAVGYGEPEVWAQRESIHDVLRADV
jgi:diaminopimelate decarboxylase